jgi:hypothetical protein
VSGKAFLCILDEHLAGARHHRACR